MARVTTVGESAALSRELSDFLIEFSIGLHKNAIYPAGHPLLADTSSELSRRLGALLQERQSLSLGVARYQLIIEGVATDDANPVLRELAIKLHRHHLGAVKFSAGVAEDELIDMLRTVSVDAGRLPRPLGLEGPEVLTQWPHIRLFPMTFAQLQLLEDEGVDGEDGQMSGAGSRAATLWVGLARAALIAQQEKLDTNDPTATDPTVVAKAIEEHKRDAAYDQVVVGYLLQIAEELKVKSGRDAVALQKRVSQLVGQLSPATLQRLMDMGGDLNQRRQFVLNASQGMAVDAVVELVKAAAESSQQNVSHSMVRMLSKLAVHADSGTEKVRDQADGALREQVGKLLDGWTHKDPNPDGYRVALEKMSAHQPTLAMQLQAYPIEAERLLAMGLEIGTLGAQVWRSADELAARADIVPLLNLIDNAPETWMRDVLWRHVATPTRLRAQLAQDPLPTAALQRLVRRMGLAAVEPLLDAVDDTADDRRLTALVELLEAVGAAAGATLMTRMSGLRWNTMRPILALLGKHPEWDCGYSPTLWQTHPDPAVRREALRQELRNPATREAAIVRALGDADEGNVRLALGAAMSNCPRDAASVLRARAADPMLSEELRALGIRALASQRAPDTPTWLAARVVKTGKLIKRESLAPKTPEMLAALEGLAMHWRDHAAAKAALSLAAASADPEIAAAAAAVARPAMSPDDARLPRATPTSLPAVPPGEQ